MKIEYSTDKESLFNVMLNKAKKNNIVIKKIGNSIEMTLLLEKANRTETVPIIFKGKIVDDEKGCKITGGFTFPFYLHALIIAALCFIVARFSWSAYEMQTDNMILCGISAAVLMIAVIVVVKKTSESRKVIMDFLNDLDIK